MEQLLNEDMMESPAEIQRRKFFTQMDDEHLLYG